MIRHGWWRRSAAGAAVALCLAALTVVAACSDDHRDAPLSAAQVRYRRQADEVCARVRRQSLAIAAPRSLADVSTLAPRLLAVSQLGLSDLQQIPPPTADVKVVAQMVRRFRKSNEHVAQLAPAAERGDTLAVNTNLDRSAEELAAFARIAKKARFGACGDGIGLTTRDAVAAINASTTTQPPPTVPEGGRLPETDLSGVLAPVTGYTYRQLPEESARQLFGQLAQSDAAGTVVEAVGDVSIENEQGSVLLMVLGLAPGLPKARYQALVDGVLGGAADAEAGRVGGTESWSFTTSAGRRGLVTLHHTNLIIALSDDSDRLTGVMSAVFAENPDL